MRKIHAVSLAVMLAAGAAMGQPAGTNAPAVPAVPAASAATTATAASAGSRQFTKEMFEQRWKMEETMYREAGISDEKIQKLHDLNMKIWDARNSGEKADFQAIMKERSEILTKDEIEKLRDLRRKQIEKQLGHEIGRTTGARVLDRNTTASAAVNK